MKSQVTHSRGGSRNFLKVGGRGVTINLLCIWSCMRGLLVREEAGESPPPPKKKQSQWATTIPFHRQLLLTMRIELGLQKCPARFETHNSNHVTSELHLSGYVKISESMKLYFTHSTMNDQNWPPYNYTTMCSSIIIC